MSVQQNGVVVHERPSITDIMERRAKAGRLVTGIAAVSDSDMFKAPTSGKPKAKNWDSHLSPESQGRPPCILKQASGYLKVPGMISLGGGFPSSEYFPYSEISMRVPTAPAFAETDPTQLVTIGKHDIRDGTSEYDLSVALNYGQATGSPQMTRFITEHTELMFNPPYADWQICQTVGSTSALEQTVRMLCDRARKDSILTEEYTFATALETIAPLGVKAFGVQMDGEGLLPESMDQTLSEWNEDARGARKPHVLYTVPSGQNPTGATQGIQRRRDIYAVCQKHDLYIIEDEPYYYLQMPAYKAQPTAPSSSDPTSVETFIAGLVPAFLSIDVDGRVLRMDSFSKVLVPGSRLGWITASAQIVQRYQRHAEVANQGPSGFSQLMLWKLLDETWGHEGYLRWLMDLRMHYTRRRDALLAVCDEFLPREVVSWTPPSSGMFLWMKVDPAKHPDYPRRSALDIEEEIFHHAIDNGVLCARGSWFRTEPGTPASEIFFRATYASASEEAMGTAIQRLSMAIRKSFQLQ
ncbi:putative L-kynurenine/alpha-aminoadipate aminotransferase [Aspergillus heteromorphus CBS 117.55]|uniref:aromatic-amino-acid transaminase n=1 Tax=Aspergillus heteromorphus CBS 117.55 TaxID=1448321 RepID=A0A317VC90_9EURO|nr:putative L-kynurenine/alpha-aminoadipate aminotransferase [Aspergillus heteromorphus CBS 117.55]PWY71029.1 putative L-kynurenine/alpha-aminoadipate aminotransferase [Aspergillus heteromorphus CBS 117.55]